jgi:hypothetical protein
MTDITVDLEALASDARVWDTVGDDLAGARSALGALTVADSAFSFAGSSASSAHEQARELFDELCRRAATQTSGAATTLRDVRDDYVACQGEVSASLARLWDPVS